MTAMRNANLVPIAVVGGEPSLIKGTFSKNLAEYGLCVGKHFNRVAEVNNIPSDCMAVICIKDMCKKSARSSALAIAKERGIPFSNVQRKWSQAKRILKSNGVLDVGLKAVNQNTTAVETADPVEKVEAAVGYIMSAMDRGRHPKIDEIQGHLQTVFGLATTVDHQEFNTYWSVASQRYNKVQPTITPETELSTDEIFAGTQTFLEENAAFMLTPKALVSMMKSIWTDEGQTLPKGDTVDAVVTRARKELREKWHQAGRRNGSRNPVHKKELQEAKERWLRQMLTKRKEQGNEPPQWVALNDECEKIFGNKFPHATWVEIRDEVFGPKKKASSPAPAPKPKTQVSQDLPNDSAFSNVIKEQLVRVPEAFRHYNALCKTHNVVPRTKSEGHFRNHLTNGSLKGVKEPRHGAPWMIHPDWVREWFLEYHQADVTTEETQWVGSDLLADDPIEVKETPVETAPVVTKDGELEDLIKMNAGYTKRELIGLLGMGVNCGPFGDGGGIPAAGELIEELMNEVESLKKKRANAEDADTKLAMADAVQAGADLIIEAHNSNSQSLLESMATLQGIVNSQAQVIEEQKGLIESLKEVIMVRTRQVKDGMKNLQDATAQNKDEVLEAVSSIQPIEVRERTVSEKSASPDFFTLMRQLDEIGYKLVPKD